MPYLLLGLAALVVGLVALQGFKGARPAVLARQLRVGTALVLLVAAAVLALRGSMSMAIPSALLGFWLLAGQQAWPFGGGRSHGSPASPQTSSIVTDHLEMQLEHDTGAMRGRVLKGVFAGRDIETLAPADLALLWQDCRFSDPRSADILEAYLDRTHATWREDVARGEERMAQGPHGRMTLAEAASILGIAVNASEDEIRRAHRELMLKLHPDRGGSTYLAAKVNEAKDVLLESKE